MLSSGNGRHRRPRPTPATVVTVATAAAAGAGIALPLFGATVAQAADNGTWDKVAICETGGLWSADTGNGFYGGLAVTQQTWDEYGGAAYAPRPDLASRAQQITVAERILSDLGPDAWPGCEQGTGLLNDTAPPSVDPGAPSATPVIPGLPLPSGPATTGPSTPAGGSTAPSASTTPADPGSPTATAPGAPATGTPTTPPTTTPGAPATPAPGASTSPGGTPGGTTPPTSGATPTAPVSGRHGKPYSPTDEDLAAADQASRTEVFSITAPATTTGGHANSVGTSGISGTSGTSGTTAASASQPAAHPNTYAVGYGDSLSGIASAHRVDGGWQALYDANHQLIGDDPNLIKPGQILNIG